MITVVIFALIWILLFVAAYQKATNAVCLSKKRLDGKTAIVTGGTAGMGLEIAKDFALRGARVIIACPFEDEGISAKKLIIKETENNNVVFKLLDLASLESTRQFAADILNNEDRLDILVNNAGLGAPALITKDGLHFIMQVNYFGAFLLTLLLLPLLKKTGIPGEPSRVINTASILHTIGTIEFDYFNSLDRYRTLLQVYGNSKLCVILFTHELSKRMHGWNVVVSTVDPGAVGTGIFAGWNKLLGTITCWLCLLLFKTPWHGAQTAIHASLDKKAGQISGGYFKNCRLSSPMKKATDDKVAKKLWEESMRLVKLSDEEFDQCFKS